MWIQLIGNSNQHQLETVTLAQQQGWDLYPETPGEIDGLEEVCKRKGIEVIWEQKRNEDTFYDCVPASFIRRAEARL
ncbi:uncharacterized protein JCM6883_003835 [Sporobolomyces salmoneus]|uniref:uncharacterized protein n=1 Tax=Sporobolomyces salmoneus TaxID=183962 RepID=UPI003179A550